MTAVETPSPTPPTPPTPPAPPPAPPAARRPPAGQVRRRTTVLCAVIAGLLAGAVVPGDTPAGLGVVLCALVAAVPAAVAAHHYGRVRATLAVIAAGLAMVPALSDSSWLVLTSGLTGLALAIVVLLDARRWTGLVAAVPIFGLASLRAPLRVTDGVSVPRIPLAAGLAWLRGLAVAAVIVPIVAALLASSDAVFAALLERAWATPGWALLPQQALALGVVAALTLGGAHAASEYRGSDDWSPDVQWPVRPARGRHPAEWLLPLVLTTAVLALFFAVQVTELFAGDDLIRRETGLTYADRAHQGFGQLIVVTVLMAGLLGWAGRAAAHRRLLALNGGALLGLTLLLAVSALRRLWLYQSAYGWTVRRLLAGSFEIWLAAMLLGLALLWVVHRTDLIPRMVLGSAGLGLLCLALAGPDAIVARADVVRYGSTGDVDVDYVARLSADAVPALDHLREPIRSQVLTAWAEHHSGNDDGGWVEWNLARRRAAGVLAR